MTLFSEMAAIRPWHPKKSLAGFLVWYLGNNRYMRFRDSGHRSQKSFELYEVQPIIGWGQSSCSGFDCCGAPLVGTSQGELDC